MLQIAICEDDLCWQNNLVKIINNIIAKNKMDASVVLQASDMDTVKSYLKKNSANVFLLDIDLHGTENGLLLARTIRRNDVNAYIVFITAHLEFLLLAFKVQAFDFLPKPVTAEILEKLLLNISSHYLQKQEASQFESKLRIKSGSSIFAIPIHSILFIERVGSDTYIHLIDKSIKTCRLSLDYLEGEFGNNECVRCHRAFIVNQRYIREINLKEKTLILDNGEACPIGGKYKQLFLDNYQDQKAE